MTSIHLPPQNLQAEASVLGAMMLSESAIDPVAEIVTASMFYSDLNGILFSSMIAMRAAGTPVDVVTVAGHLERIGKYAEIGGEPALSRIMEAAPYTATANAIEYASAVRDCWRRRLAQTAGQDLIHLAQDKSTPIDESLATAEAVLHRAISGSVGNGPKSIAELLPDVLVEL